MALSSEIYFKVFNSIAYQVLGLESPEMFESKLNEEELRESKELVIEFSSLIPRAKKIIEEKSDFFRQNELDLDIKLLKVKRLLDDLREQDRIEKLINHKMEFLNPNITDEQRLNMLKNLSQLDKDKLIQLEASLMAQETGEFNFDPDGFYDGDKKFLSSFSEGEILEFIKFQQSLSQVDENRKVR